MPPDPSPALIAEQFSHAVDLLKADMAHLRSSQDHDREFMTHRMTQSEIRLNDQETRIRSATEGVTTFKAYAGFLSLLSILISIAAIVRSFFQ